MNFKITHEESFFLIAISCRTDNSKAAQDIGKLWDRFFAEGISQKISNRRNDDIYNCYYDFESDENGPYTVLLGHSVSSLEDIPEGMIALEIPSASYANYSSEGKVPDIVFNTWSAIYQERSYQRSYGVDFDLYPAGQQDPSNMKVETFVSIKS